VKCALDSFKRLQQLKRRDPKKPFSLLVADLSHLAHYAQVSNFAYRILRQLAPGPFTFILPATRLVPELLLHRRREVGLRIPDAPVARALSLGLGRPLVTTTATDEDGRPIPDAPAVRDAYGHTLDQVLDAGLRSGEPSTLVSLIGDRLEVLRAGAGVLTGL
jgi:tRNA threonylcarbamoyl adenosine modification protein (Sua5/YciO/YrdC/YwlC family)